MVARAARAFRLLGSPSALRRLFRRLTACISPPPTTPSEAWATTMHASSAEPTPSTTMEQALTRMHAPITEEVVDWMRLREAVPRRPGRRRPGLPLCLPAGFGGGVPSTPVRCTQRNYLTLISVIVRQASTLIFYRTKTNLAPEKSSPGNSKPPGTSMNLGQEKNISGPGKALPAPKLYALLSKTVLRNSLNLISAIAAGSLRVSPCL